MCEALSGNTDLMRKSFNEQNVSGHLRALLLIAQTVRCNPKENGCSRPAQCLRLKAEKLRDSLNQCKAAAPTMSQVEASLRAYAILTNEEIKTWLNEVG
jgi:hypothetical protein